MTDDRRCTCGHAEADHYRGECIAAGTRMNVCPCSRFELHAAPQCSDCGMRHGPHEPERCIEGHGLP